MNTPGSNEHLEERMSALESAFSALGERIARLTDSIGALVTTVSHSRRITRALIISVVFDLMLSAGFVYVQYRTSHTASVAHQAAQAAQAASDLNAANAVRVCLASNEFRAEALVLWNKVASLVTDSANSGTSPPQTPAQKANLDSLIDLARSTYAQRPC